jgi:hypothetical protein
MRPLITLGLAALLAISAGCGAEADAPAPPAAPPAAQCPTLPELAPNTLALLRSGGLVAVRDLLENQLDDGELIAVVDGLLRMIRALDRPQLEAVLALAHEPLLLDLLPLLRDVLAFIADDLATPQSLGSQVMVESARLIQTCDGPTLFLALDALLAAPELSTVLTALSDTLRLDIVAQVLDVAQGGALARPGFTTLVCNLLAALIRPDFTIATALIEPLAGVDLLPLDQPPISTLLQSLDTILAPERPVLPALRDVVCCDLYGVGRCADLTPQTVPLMRDPVFTWLLHALLVSDVVQIDTLLSLVARLEADPRILAALQPLGTVLRQMAADPDLREAFERLLVRLLQPEIAQRVLPELVAALDANMFPELIALVDALAYGCDVEVP